MYTFEYSARDKSYFTDLSYLAKKQPIMPTVGFYNPHEYRFSHEEKYHLILSGNIIVMYFNTASYIPSWYRDSCNSKNNVCVTFINYDDNLSQLVDDYDYDYQTESEMESDDSDYESEPPIEWDTDEEYSDQELAEYPDD